MRRAIGYSPLALIVALAVVGIAHATFTCNVLSAKDGSTVTGALCSLRSTNEVTLFGSAYTDIMGNALVNYNFSSDSENSYLARVGHPDFYVADQVFTVPSLTEDYSLSISVSPILNTSAIRAVLKWGPNPTDLDSHVWISSPDFTDCNHVYYSNKECVGGNGVVNLDLDDTSGYGPETITLTSLPVGNYSYWVWIYSSGTFDDSVPIPTVELYSGSTGNGVFKTFTAPIHNTTDRAWHVFDVIVAPSQTEVGCTSVTVSDVNQLYAEMDTTGALGPSAGTRGLADYCASNSSICNNRHTGTRETCGNFGDPHIMMWNRTGVTCRAEGTSLLVDNEWFSLGMHNVQVDQTTGATATDLIRFIYKRCNPMTIDITPGSFPEPIDSADAGLHTIRKSGNNLYLDGINTRIQVRESGDYLIFGMSTPFFDGPGLCSGCAPGDSLDTDNPVVTKRKDVVAYTVDSANTACANAGLTGFFLKSCVFDLVTTGNDTFIAQASEAVAAYNEVQIPFTSPEPPTTTTTPTGAASTAVPSFALLFAFVALFLFNMA